MAELHSSCISRRLQTKHCPATTCTATSAGTSPATYDVRTGITSAVCEAALPPPAGAAGAGCSSRRRMKCSRAMWQN